MFKGKEKGFTIIEMMIVIVIIGVMTVVVGIKYRDYKDKLTLTRVTREVLTDMRQAKAETKREKERYRVTFNQYGYTVDNIDYETAPPLPISSLSKDFSKILGTTDITLTFDTSPMTFDTAPLRLGWIEGGANNRITITHSNKKIDTNAVIIRRLGTIDIFR